MSNESTLILLGGVEGVIVFGPNPLPSTCSIAGAPVGDFQVKVNDGPLNPLRGNVDPATSPTTEPNTGNMPFQLGPIYLDYSTPGGLGTTYFDIV